jgi:hypothetical protein
MISFIRRLLSRKARADDAQTSTWDPQLFLYVKIPGDVQPLVRGERFEDPLASALQEANLGDVSGGGSQLADPYPDGRPRVEFCGMDIEVSDRDRARALVMRKLIDLQAPRGTEIHYTAGSNMLLDRLMESGWNEGLPRIDRHPSFGV